MSCTKLQLLPEPLTSGLPPPDPRPLSSTEFVENPHPEKFLGYANDTVHNCKRLCVHQMNSRPAVFCVVIFTKLVASKGRSEQYLCCGKFETKFCHLLDRLMQVWTVTG